MNRGSWVLSECDRLRRLRRFQREAEAAAEAWLWRVLPAAVGVLAAVLTLLLVTA